MKRIITMFFLLICLAMLTACGEEQVDQTKIYSVYYVSNSETKIEMHEYYMEAEETWRMPSRAGFRCLSANAASAMPPAMAVSTRNPPPPGWS